EMRIAQHHPVLRGVEDRAVLLLACPQRVLGALARADVAQDAQDMRATLVPERDATQLDCDAAAVLAHALRFDHGRLACQHPAVPLPDRRLQLGRAAEHAILAERLLAREATLFDESGVDVNDAEILVAQDHHVGDGVEDVAVAVLRIAQPRLRALACAEDLLQTVYREHAASLRRAARAPTAFTRPLRFE